MTISSIGSIEVVLLDLHLLKVDLAGRGLLLLVPSFRCQRIKYGLALYLILSPTSLVIFLGVVLSVVVEEVMSPLAGAAVAERVLGFLALALKVEALAAEALALHLELLVGVAHVEHVLLAAEGEAALLLVREDLPDHLEGLSGLGVATRHSREEVGVGAQLRGDVGAPARRLDGVVDRAG